VGARFIQGVCQGAYPRRRFSPYGEHQSLAHIREEGHMGTMWPLSSEIWLKIRRGGGVHGAGAVDVLETIKGKMVGGGGRVGKKQKGRVMRYFF